MISILGPVLFSLAMIGVAAAAPAGSNIVERGEYHRVEIVNNCGAGRAVFKTGTQGEQSVTNGQPVTVSGSIHGGIAYLRDYADCGENGLNCGMVEFSLINPDWGQQWPMQNSINYSLLDGLDRATGGSLGNHKFKYSMNFAYTGSASACRQIEAPGQCVGQSKDQCPGSFIADETEGGAPVNCLGDNAGILITFC